ncbi:MAG: CotH kinase family protein, partial [bacterium]
MKADPEHITIDIKHKDFQKLAYKRNIAWAKGILITNSDDYVPAKIRYKNKTIKVKIRLKGDNIDHLEGDKWSFRVKIKGEETLFGMKIFSLQHPKTRSYIYEWLFHQALKREDILSPRYKFIDVDINGKNYGIYALEEHFEKRLLEHNQLREGPILKFNEDLFWEEILQQGRRLRRTKRIGSGSFFSSHVDAFQTKKLLSDSLTCKSYIKSINLLEAFRKGVLKTSEVFDIPKLAKYFAIVDLMSAWHGSQWINKRFYYNPITSLLEPIGFDGYFEGGGKIPIKFLITKLPSRGGIHDNKYLPLIFEDMKFYREYIKALERMCKPSYLDKMFSDLKVELQQNLNIIHSQYPYFHFSIGSFRQNQHYIKTILNPVKGMHAYLHKVFDNHIELELGNIQSMPIEVLTVSYGDSIIFQHMQEIILKALNPQKPVQYRNFSFKFPQGFVWSDTVITGLKVNYRILGTSRERYVNVYQRSHLDENFVKNDFIRQGPNIDKFKFLIFDESTKNIFIKPGIWNVGQNLIIPEGYKVICTEGTQLNLSNSAKILSYSPLKFIGSDDSPIIIQSIDSTGQGIIVMNANETSVLEYVTFNNLSNPSQGGWELTGAVTFYHSPVNISHCQFIGNRSEDGL